MIPDFWAKFYDILNLLFLNVLICEVFVYFFYCVYKYAMIFLNILFYNILLGMFLPKNDSRHCVMFPIDFLSVWKITVWSIINKIWMFLTTWCAYLLHIYNATLSPNRTVFLDWNGLIRFDKNSYFYIKSHNSNMYYKW